MSWIKSELNIILKLCLIFVVFCSCKNEKHSDLDGVDVVWESIIFPAENSSFEHADELKFKVVEELDLGFFQGTIFIRIKVANKTSKNKEFIVLSKDKINRSYRFYITDCNHDKLIPYNNKEFNISYNDSRSYNFVLPNFKIELGPNETNVYYMTVESDGRIVSATPYVLSHNYYLEFVNNEIIRDSLLYSAMVIILLINLIYTFVNRKIIFAYYTFYILFTCVLFLGLDGYLYGYGVTLHVIDHLIFISLRLSMLFFLLFTINLLNIKTLFPKVYVFSMRYCVGVFTGMTLYQFIFFNSSIQYLHIIENGVTSSWVLIISILSIISLRKIKPELKFYIIGLSLYLGFLLLGLIYTHLISFPTINTNYSVFLKIGSIVEIIFFTYTIIVIMNKKEVEVRKMKESTLLKDIEYREKINKRLIESHQVDTSLINSRLLELLNNTLTKRELEVLVELCTGKKNKEISESLFISVNTVRSHLLNIYEKMEVNNRVQAVKMAENLSRIEKGNSKKTKI